MSLYDHIADLKVEVESYDLKPLKKEIPGGLIRHTTVVQFRGRGQESVGEDVTYEAKDQQQFQKHGKDLTFNGIYSIDSFSKQVAGQELFQTPPANEAFRQYRQWAFESAALSLALKQAGKSLAEVLGLESKPFNFVASRRLGQPSSVEPLQELLKLYPKLHFKLDPTNDWTDELIDQIASLNVVDTIDLKSFYKGTPVDVQTDPVLYQKIVDNFPKAWIEDPDVTDETRHILEPHTKRISWDAPIDSVDDIKARPFPVQGVNIKPSRFGALKKLFDTYDYCSQNKITMYGGGQFELGPGRPQIQYLTSLFHPDGPNDTAPIGYNELKTPPDLPASPLKINWEF